MTWSTSDYQRAGLIARLTRAQRSYVAVNSIDP